jgi:XTP/dITP diphosphohydrolase
MPGTDSTPSELEKFERLIGVVHTLRANCPWTASQTHASLVPFAEEEARELTEVLADRESGRATGADVASELGDLLLQVMLHAEIGSESEDPELRVTLDMVLEALTQKLIRRSPHVFAPDGSVRITPMSIEEIDAQWDAIKAAEKSETSSKSQTVPGVLD